MAEKDEEEGREWLREKRENQAQSGTEAVLINSEETRRENGT